MENLSLAVCMILLPFIYRGMMELQRDSFEKDENRTRRFLQSQPERIVLLISEIALVRIWFALGRCTLDDMVFQLLFVMLAGMTVLCMTDYWERIVPNKLLLLCLICWGLIVGGHAVHDMNIVFELIPMMVMGFIFCLITFGLGYAISRGSMGAGDVKLSLVMGICLTGKYVVGAVLYGCIISAVYSVVQLARKKLTRKDTLPFVPFLYIGLIIRYLIG